MWANWLRSDISAVVYREHPVCDNLWLRLSNQLTESIWNVTVYIVRGGVPKLASLRSKLAYRNRLQRRLACLNILHLPLDQTSQPRHPKVVFTPARISALCHTKCPCCVAFMCLRPSNSHYFSPLWIRVVCVGSRTSYLISQATKEEVRRTSSIYYPVSAQLKTLTPPLVTDIPSSYEYSNLPP